jgi:1-acyl-sn-glycerol-3-phosphate acyltransferase
VRGAPVERPPFLYRFVHRFLIPLGIGLLCRLRVTGLHNVPRMGPLVLASNHVDNLDAGALGYPVGRFLHFMGRPEVFREALRGFVWRRLAAIPADGEGLTEGIAILRRGGAVAIFPEGVIAPVLVPARAGTGILAMRAKAVIVPVAITGTDRIALPRSLLWRTRVRVQYGVPIDAGVWPAGPGKAQELTDLVMTRIAEMLPPEYRGAYAGMVNPT